MAEAVTATAGGGWPRPAQPWGTGWGAPLTPDHQVGSHPRAALRPEAAHAEIQPVSPRVTNQPALVPGQLGRSGPSQHVTKLLLTRTRGFG